MYKCFKWVADRVLALIAIAVISPLLLALMLAVVIDSKGAPFIVQKRDGYKKKTIKVVKFRTMFSANFDFDIEHPVVEAGDSRVTRIGGFLRRTKLDELPQLFNVLIGDMSFVGPRPLLPVYTPRYERWEFQKFAVYPGMTGLPQVKGNGYLSVKSRSYYDALYTEKISLWTDFKILLLTVGVILRGEEAFKKEATEEEIDALKRRYQSPDGTVTVGEVLWEKKDVVRLPDTLATMDLSHVELHVFTTDSIPVVSAAELSGWKVHVLPEPPHRHAAIRAFRKVLRSVKIDVIRCREPKSAQYFLKAARREGVEVRIAPAVLEGGSEGKALERNRGLLREATVVQVPTDRTSEAIESGEFYRSLIKGAKR
ncbi:MAG: sugar transferase [Clostridia bacterium]|nr:sugar transferase [Clostridia bacterium]